MEKVAITGRGLVTPIGTGLAANEESLLAGRSGIRHIPLWKEMLIDSQVAGISDEDPACPLVDGKKKRFMSPNSLMAAAAAWEALGEAGLTPESLAGMRVAIINGCAGCSYTEVHENAKIYEETLKLRKISPCIVPRVMPSSAVANLSLILGIKGESYDISSACTSGAHAIVLATRLLQWNLYDVVIAGGSEEVNWIQALGFCAMRALSRKYNDTPAKASRPFDRDRDGFVIAEGAGMVILERADHAAKRNASVKGYVTGYALNSNASDMVAPSPAASASVMAEAVGAAGLRPDDIGYVNTHGTATPIGDPAEMEALRLVFGSGKSPAINSTKSMTGHMIGASGAVEAIFCSMMIEKQFVCPSVNLDNPEPEFAWADLVRETRRGVKLRHALSNSFGFGGSNACIIISSPEIFS